MFQALHKFSSIIITLLIFLISFPIISPYMAEFETKYLPVIKNIKVLPPTLHRDGISFYVNFDKIRQCEFIGLSWYDNNGTRLKLDFESSAKNTEETRPTGEWNVGPWFLHDVSSLEDTRAYTFHKCHPLWITISEFFINK